MSYKILFKIQNLPQMTKFVDVYVRVCVCVYVSNGFTHQPPGPKKIPTLGEKTEKQVAS